MFPTINIFGQNVFLYDILSIAGTLIGLAVSIAVMIKKSNGNKRITVSYMLSLALSFPFAYILRHIMESDSIEEFFDSAGSHFMGMFFAFYFIFPMIYKALCKENIPEEIRCISVLYFAIQHFFSRIGCYSLGCCFGKPYNGIFAVIFPYGTNPFNEYGKEIPLFPTQLFEAFAMPILFFSAVIGIVKKKKIYNIAVVFFSLIIFISECFMFRYDYERTFLNFTIPQLCSMVLFVSELIRKSEVLSKIRER